MAQSPSMFEIDTKGTCLFCLNPKCAPLDRSNLDLTTATSFKMLFRYLNIDLGKLSSDSLTNYIVLNESSHLAASLCDTCFFLVDEFVELFQDFERIRLKLEACTWKLHGFMGTGSKDKDRVQEYRRRVQHSGDTRQSKFVEELRKKTFERCSGKRFSSIPKVRLRGGTTNMLGGVSSELPKIIQAESISTVGIGTEINLVQFKTEAEDNLQAPFNDQDCHQIKPQPQKRKQILTPRPMSSIPEIEMEGNDDDNLDEEIMQVHREVEDLAGNQVQIMITTPVTAHELPLRQMLVDGKKCNKCDKQFLRRRTLIKHYRNNHMSNDKAIIYQNESKCRSVKCDYCSKYFAHRASLRTHQFLVHPVQMLSKSIPTSTSEKDLKSAVDKIFASAEIVRNADAQKGVEFNCPLCSRIVLTSSTTLRVHILRKHVDKICETMQAIQTQTPLSYKVEGAGIAQITRAHIINKISNSSSKKLSVTCDICGRWFHYMKYLKAHKYRVHTPGSFKCQFCPKKFLLDKTLQRHLQVVHLEMLDGGKSSFTFSCDYCDKVYPTKKNLQRHLDLKHVFLIQRTGIPSSISEHVFESALAAIEAKIRPGGKIRDYQRGKCVFCGNMLRCATTDLRVHIVRKHLEKVIDNAEAILASADKKMASFVQCKHEYPSLISSAEEAESGFDHDGVQEDSFAGEDPLGI